MLDPRPHSLYADEIHSGIVHLPPGHGVTRLEAMIRETSDIAVDKERFGHVNERAGDHGHDECWESVQCASASGYTTRSRRDGFEHTEEDGPFLFLSSCEVGREGRTMYTRDDAVHLRLQRRLTSSCKAVV
jgi:hypothetical protein